MNVIEFADRESPPEDEDQRHAKAFRDLEPEVCDLDRLGEITEGLMADVLDHPTDGRRFELAFLMAQKLAEALQQFKVDYYAAWYGKREPE